MRNSVKRPFYFVSFLILAGLIVAVGHWQYQQSGISPELSFEELENEGMDKIETKAARNEYFFRMLRDPATNRIPPNIRSRELNHAQQMPTRNQQPLQLRKKDGTMASVQFNWQATGPFDLGGRTRALAIDQQDNSTIIAGGVSGGIWKSTNGGTSWELKTDPSQQMSVTSVAQDPTSPDTWYYTSGELIGNSASDRLRFAPYYGTGVFRSTDNGETWTKIPETEDFDTNFNSPYDYITRVVVSPTTGSVFIASNGIGIYKATDSQPFPQDQGQGIPEPVLGTPAGHLYADVAVGSDGRLVAALSSADASGGTVSGNPGIFVSFNDGGNGDWTEITSDIENFPTEYQRSVIAISESNPDIFYILTYVSGSGGNEDVRLHYVDLNNFDQGGNIISEDRSSNIPDFGSPVGYMSTQSNYNMEVAVKPDDPNLVLIGGINLFRSFDGFATAPNDTDGDGFSDGSQKDEFWIGGYRKENDIRQYLNQHPDQHVVKFDPTDSNVVFAGHDGGISRTSDITANAVSWSDQNNDYVTSQFYAIDIPEDPEDDRIMGGTQDNGTPFFRFTGGISEPDPTFDAFTGDGGYSFFTPAYLFVSAQNGIVLRRGTDSEGNPTDINFAYVHPSQAQSQFFIHPYEIDPNDNDAGIMYYPSTDSLLRNTQVNEIANTQNSGGTSEGWELVSEINESGPGNLITALEVSKTPANILYYAAYASNGTPRIFKLENSNVSTSPQELTLPDDVANGSFPHDIAINPANANEALLIFSNYEVPSIFHTSDGGDSWQNVEGNLNSVSANAGPSVRSATIIPGEAGTIYLLGTSTGIYSASNLSGDQTQWVQEAPNSLGNTVTQYITSRTTDGTVAAGTHGRGAYVGDFEGSISNAPFITFDPSEASFGENITITAVNFQFSTELSENQVLFNGIEGEIVGITSSELTVTVPRIPRVVQNNSDEGEPGRTVQIEVTSGSMTLDALNTLQLLSPNEFVLRQNFPNPFNPSTTIPFDLPSESGVILEVFDITGRKVLEPVRQVLVPDTYNFQIDLGDLSSGVYFYRIVAIPQGSGEPIVETKKMTLIK